MLVSLAALVLVVTNAKSSVSCGEYCTNGKCTFTMDYL